MAELQKNRNIRKGEIGESCVDFLFIFYINVTLRVRLLHIEDKFQMTASRILNAALDYITRSLLLLSILWVYFEEYKTVKNLIL